MDHIEGRNKGKVELYALSTCVWCKQTKKLLDKLNVEYYFLNIDLIDEKEEEKIREKIIKFNPSYSFPTLIINDEYAIVGYKKDRIMEVLG